MGHDQDRRRVNKGYHYVRYGLFGFFMILFTKLIDWIVIGIVPPLLIATLGTAVTVLIIIMDARNQKLWRENESVEFGPDPGPPVVTKYLYTFYVACLLGLLLLCYRPTRAVLLPPSQVVTPLQHVDYATRQTGAAPEPASQEGSKDATDPRTVVRQEVVNLITTRQTLAARIQQDQQELQTLATQRQQLTGEVQQSKKALQDLSTQGERAATAAAAQAKVVEAQQRQLAEQRVVMQTQERELAASRLSVERQRAAVDDESQRLAQRTQALARQGWTVTLNAITAIMVIVAGCFVVAASALKVYGHYYH